MIRIDSLYNPIEDRYKNVTQRGKRWQANVLTLEGNDLVRGTYTTREEAARAVATYYKEIFGEDWEEMVRTRRAHVWRVRKIARTMTLTVWLAQVRTCSKEWYGITSTDMGFPEHPGWSVKGEGWLSSADALIAVRTYRFLEGISSCVLKSSPDVQEVVRPYHAPSE